jgi:hypothetical protein
VIIVVDVDHAEQDLAAGRLTCPRPRCHGALRAWARAARRRVRRLDAPNLVVQPRRARYTAWRDAGAPAGIVPAKTG